MWFNSFSFLWFLPTVLIGYYAIPSWRGRKIALLIASYFFYGCWNPPFVLLLAASSLVDFMLFIAFVPQLVAGPILRAAQFVPQLETRRENDAIDWMRGGFLIILGLFQKVVLADNIAPLANLVFNDPGSFNTIELWVGVYAFAFQIYFDFAGYSNIAIGTARLLGFS